MSTSALHRPTIYKKVARWQVSDYMAALEQYNRPFKSIVRRSGNTLLVSDGMTIPEYAPPYPPWIDTDKGGSDNVFDYQVDAYNTQLQALKARRGNMANPDAAMVEILNRPPVPRMPPANAGVIEDTPRPGPTPAAPPPPPPAAETNAAYNARLYNQLYENGRAMYGMLFPQGRYEGDVPNEPPTAKDNNYETQEKFFELYDKLREIWATVKGDEPFSIVMPRYRLVAEAFQGSQRIGEGFAGLKDQYYPKAALRTAEGFASPEGQLYPKPTRSVGEGFLAGRTCAPYESYLAWFFGNSTVRNADREQMKIDFCAGMQGYEYIPGDDTDCAINCYLKQATTTTTGTGAATGGTGAATAVNTISSSPNPPATSIGSPTTTTPRQNTMADGVTIDRTPPVQVSPAPAPAPPGTPSVNYPATYIGTTIDQVQKDTAKYNYNWFNFDQSKDIDSAGRRAASYNKDSYDFKMSKQSQFKRADIDEYYSMLTTYNDFWLYKYGWRDQSNRDRPYNPPMPIWLDPSDEPADKAYVQSITTYNDKVKNLLRAYMENSPAVRLPDDFRPLPEPPAYPSLLKDLLTNPKKYADKQQGGSEIPDTPEGGTYTIPTAYLLSMLQAARDKLQVVASTSSSAAPGTPGGAPLPKCPGAPCKKYSDYVPDFVKKYFDDQAAQKQTKKIQSGFMDYAFGRPGPR